MLNAKLPWKVRRITNIVIVSWMITCALNNVCTKQRRRVSDDRNDAIALNLSWLETPGMIKSAARVNQCQILLWVPWLGNMTTPREVSARKQSRGGKRSIPARQNLRVTNPTHDGSCHTADCQTFWWAKNNNKNQTRNGASNKYVLICRTSHLEVMWAEWDNIIGLSKSFSTYSSTNNLPSCLIFIHAWLLLVAF